MGQLRIGLQGHHYDDSEPLYLTTSNGMVWNRVSRGWSTWDSLARFAEGFGHVWGDNEVGVPSDAWIAANGGNWAPLPGLTVEPEPEPVEKKKKSKPKPKKEGD